MHHRRQRSNERSTAYYRTERGKTIKADLNARRKKRLSRTLAQPQAINGLRASSELQTVQESEVIADQQEGVAPSGTVPQGTRRNIRLPDAFEVQIELKIGQIRIDQSTLRNSRIVPYLRLLVRLIDSIELSCEELIELLLAALRQHSLAYRTKNGYVLAFLHQHPP